MHLEGVGRSLQALKTLRVSNSDVPVFRFRENLSSF